MRPTKVIFGSSTGVCEDIAGRIAEKLGVEAINVTELTDDIVKENDNLILGTSSWGSGEVQDDWYDGIETLKQNELSDKTVAIFGCGDSMSYGDTFCGGMSSLYEVAKDGGANVIGSVSADDYNYEDSEAVVDNKFVGLALDEENEPDKTDERIENWINEIRTLL